VWRALDPTFDIAKLPGMITAGNRLSLFAMPTKRRGPIKHSFKTALRQVRCTWGARIHRFGPKSPAPLHKLACGLIGAGGFFRYAYLPALNRKDSPLSVTGVLTRSEQSAGQAQQALRYVARHFDSIRAIRDSGATSVLILAPNNRHSELAHEALGAGLHVFCEKPLTNTVTEALALRSQLKPGAPTLMVDFNQRYLERNCVLKQVITEGRVGRIETVEAFHNQDLTSRLPDIQKLSKEVTGGGVVHNAGIHFINLFLYWFGDVDRVKAVFENRVLPRECGEDTAFCRFWFRNGVTATLEASIVNAVATTYERVRFIGQNGEISSDLKKGGICCRLGENKRVEIPCRKEVVADSVFNALTHFKHCVSAGNQPDTDVNDFIRTMKVVEALTLSAQRSTDVHLDELERKYA